MTQSNAGCSGRRGPRKGKSYRGKTCCFELAEGAIEARTRDGGASNAVRLDVLGSFTTINPCCTARQTQADVDRVIRASREDVDVRADGTSEAHSLPFRARMLMLPWAHRRPLHREIGQSYDDGLLSPRVEPKKLKWEKSRRRGWNRSRGNRPVILGRGAFSHSSHRISAARVRARSSRHRVARSAPPRERKARDHTEHRIGLQTPPRPSQLFPFTGIPRSASIARSCSGERPSVVR